MSFHLVPGLRRIPKVPMISRFASGIWCGAGADAGYCAFRSPFHEVNAYVIVSWRDLVPSLRFYKDGSAVTLPPVYGSVNGYMYWGGSGNWIYYSVTKGWVYSGAFAGELSLGQEPEEAVTYNENVDEEWYAATIGGSTYYEVHLPAGIGRSGRMEVCGPRAEEVDTPEVELTMVWPRWELMGSAERFGKYEGADGKEGTRVFGVPQFSGGDMTFVRSVDKDKTGHYTYGKLHCESGRWVIGAVGSPSGWLEGSEPQVDGSVAFTFQKPEGSDATGTGITVSFDGYVAGTEKGEAYLGSVAVWR